MQWTLSNTRVAKWRVKHESMLLKRKLLWKVSMCYTKPWYYCTQYLVMMNIEMKIRTYIPRRMLRLIEMNINMCRCPRHVDCISHCKQNRVVRVYIQRLICMQRGECESMEKTIKLRHLWIIFQILSPCAYRLFFHQSISWSRHNRIRLPSLVPGSLIRISYNSFSINISISDSFHSVHQSLFWSVVQNLGHILHH